MTGTAGTKKTKKLPVGLSDFRKIIEGDYCYIDKSLFIKEIIDRGDSILHIPRDNELTGYVIEFKSVDEEDNETVESTLRSALQQIEDKKYETELVDRKIKHIKKLAIAFKGKHVHVKQETDIGPTSKSLISGEVSR